MTDAELAAAIHDACKRGATISAIKCFVESIRRDERKVCAIACREDESGRDSGGYFADLLMERSNQSKLTLRLKAVKC